MKISREQMSWHRDIQLEESEEAFEAVLGEMGIEVEPEPIPSDITSGEWLVEQDKASNWAWQVHTLDNRGWMRICGSCSEADAKLIAAAPDAIAVIKRAYDHLIKNNPHSTPLLDEFRDVLRKAGVDI